ncbi:MAG: glycosyltransferase family 4 protein [Candidatus Edwardsbacteria bacterium]|jgi:hypothetical protein|nr:glycosyltransferase family 4 protein [Candidatus Edwardsbacteria bacterium]
MQYLSFLDRRDNTVVLCSFRSRHDTDIGERCKELTRALPSIREVVLLDLPSPLTAAVNCLCYALLKRNKSFQECLYYDRPALGRLRAAVAEHRPDIICFDMVRTVQYHSELKTGAARSVFLMQDILSDRYRGMLRTNLKVLGSFTENLPAFVGILADRMLRTILLTSEVKRLAASEAKYIRAVDHTILVSPVEAARLKREYPEASVVGIPPAATRGTAACRPITHSLSFMGLLNYSPNEEGLLRFIRNIFPAVVSQYPDVTFRIIGSKPTAEIRKAVAAHNDRIVLAGFVEDYRSAVCQTEIFIAPIYSGSGVNVKIIDALALGMPVVTTTTGADGLPVSDREDILIAKTDDEYADHVIRLMGDVRLRKRLSLAARDYSAKHHDDGTIRNTFLDVLGLREPDGGQRRP